jgi:hypothetical protein
LDQHAFDHLSRLPTVCKLSLRSILPTYASSQNTDTPLFAALRKLDIWPVDVSCMTHFLSLCGPLQLISLDLPLHNSLSTASEMHNLLGIISSKVSLSSLTTVAVGSQGRWDDFLEVEIPTDHVIGTISPFGCSSPSPTLPRFPLHPSVDSTSTTLQYLP